MHRDEETGRFVRDERDQPHRRPMRRTPARPAGRYQTRSQGGCPDSGAAVKTTLGLLAGAGIGAGLMYLFDPYEGPTRRQWLSDTAGSTWESVSERAREAGSTIAEHLPSMPSASEVRDRGQKFFSRASDAAQDKAGEWMDSARSALPSRPRLRRPTDLSATSAALGGLGLIALSVAATWLFDPQRGRGRRTWIAQKATRYMNETGDFMRATGRHLRNRARGVYYETRSTVAENMSAAGMQPTSSTESCPESIAGPTSI